MIGQGELRRLTPHASRITHHASRRAWTRTKTICPPFGGHNKQCRPAHRQSTKTTVTETYTNFADKPKPTQSQGRSWRPKRPEPTVLRMYSVGRSIMTIWRRPLWNCPRTLLSLRNRHSHECRRLWPRWPTPMVLELCSTSRTIRILWRRISCKCPRTI